MDTVKVAINGRELDVPKAEPSSRLRRTHRNAGNGDFRFQDVPPVKFLDTIPLNEID